MNPSAKNIISRELRPGETLLWSGQPPAGIRLRPIDALVIPFSLLWGGFAIFWETMVISMRAPWFFKLWGIPFVLVGLYIIAGRFYVDMLIRRGTYYGVTNERVIILNTGPFTRRTRSLDLRTLGELELSERGNGDGTISFGRPYPFSSFTIAGWPGSGAFAAPTFELGERAREVYEIIRKAQREAPLPS